MLSYVYWYLWTELSWSWDFKQELWIKASNLIMILAGGSLDFYTDIPAHSSSQNWEQRLGDLL